jgi:hypothetical protein
MLTMLSAFRAKDRLLKSLPELQIHATQLARDGSPPPGLRLPHAKLSRNSNQIARGRIRRFESDMPSHAVDRHCRPASPPLGREHIPETPSSFGPRPGGYIPPCWPDALDQLKPWRKSAVTGDTTNATMRSTQRRPMANLHCDRSQNPPTWLAIDALRIAPSESGDSFSPNQWFEIPEAGQGPARDYCPRSTAMSLTEPFAGSLKSTATIVACLPDRNSA